MGKKVRNNILKICMLSFIVAFFVMLAGNSSFAATCSHNVRTRTVSPSCTSQGYTEAYCTKCGKSISKSNYRAALGHNYKAYNCTTDKCSRCPSTRSGGTGHSPKDGSVIQSASCTNAGVISRVCSKCGAGCGSRTISPLGHNYQPYDCTNDKCTRCTSKRSGGTGHSPKDGAVMQNASCTNVGVISRVCSKCGAGCGSRTTPALGHNYQAYNCTTDKCSRCPSTRSGGTGHSPKDGSVIQSVSCTNAGVVSRVCSKCGAGCGSRTIAALGHDYKPYDCTNDKCTRCTSKRSGGTGHSPVDGAVMQSVSCTNPGIISRVCSKCGAGCGSRTVPANGHSTKYEYTDPGCDMPGYKKEVCQVCSKVISSTAYADPVGHDYKAFDCDEDKCTRCNKRRSGGLGHKPKDDKTMKNPTCTEVGVVSLVCDRCGAGCGSRTIPANGHSTKYEYTDPECDMPGYKNEVCQVCSKVISSTPYADPTGHDYKPFDCDEDKCTKCDKRRSGGLGHKPKDDKTMKNPTCTEVGVVTLVCDRCGAGCGSRTIPANGHSTKYEYTDPECDKPGYKNEVCKICSTVVSSTPYTDPLGHDLEHINCVEDRCKRCSAVISGGFGHVDGYTDGDHWHVTSPDLGDPTEMGSKHEFQCSVCGEWDNWTEHTWSRFENLAPGSHIKICKCGVYRPEKCETGENGTVCKYCNAEINHTCHGEITYQELDRFATQIYGHMGVCEDPYCPGFVEEHDFVPKTSDTPPNAKYYIWLEDGNGGGQYIYMECSKKGCGSTDILPPEELTEMMALDDAEKERMQRDLGFVMNLFLNQVGRNNAAPLTEYEYEVLKFNAMDNPDRPNAIQKALKWLSKLFLGIDDDYFDDFGYRYKLVKTQAAEEVNGALSSIYSEPPFKPGTTVDEIELVEQTRFVRVYDGDNSPMAGGWFMREEDIAGLTPAQIKDKYALVNEPRFVCDLVLDSGTHVQRGVANGIDGWGNGDGIQYYSMGQRFDTFINERSLGD